MTTAEYQAAIYAIYDFERIFEAAIAGALTTAGLVCATPDTITQFQTQRPRVEVIFKPSAGRFKDAGGVTLNLPVFQWDTTGAVPPQNAFAPGAYSGDVSLTVVTNAGEPDKELHATYRAMVRFVMDTLKSRVNGQWLTNHFLQFITPTNTTLVFENKDGYWTSSLAYTLDFSIQPAAFNSILQPPTS